MKILAIGDPHGDLKKIKKIPIEGVDLILITGDLGKADLLRKRVFENVERRRKKLPEKVFTSRESKRAFMESYTTSMKVVRYLSKFVPVMTIYGNIEGGNTETKAYSLEIGLRLPFLTDDLNSIKNVRVINNRIVKVGKTRIGGLQYFVDTNWVRDFKPSNYRNKMSEAKKETDRAARILRKFGDIDVLVCHQPPYRFLDKVTFKQAPKNWKGKNAGSKAILDYIRKKQPRYVFCGHIHEGEGHVKIGKTEVYNLGNAGYKIIDI